jgi:predicted ATPase
MLASIADPQRAPEMLAVRESIRGWRFYEGFRTDAASPVRLPQVGTFTPVLNDDGTDLPVELETIRLFGDGEALDRTIEDAFPGSRVDPGAETPGFDAPT